MTDCKEYDKKDGWTDADIAMHKSIPEETWRAFGWKIIVFDDNDNFEGTVVIHRMGREPEYRKAMFVKELPANPIYSPKYVPIIEGVNAVGPMFNGTRRNGYMVMDRYEDQATYDLLSD